MISLTRKQTVRYLVFPFGFCPWWMMILKNVVGLLPVKYSLTQAQFALLAQKPLPAKAEMFMTVNIATKKVAFDRFENVEAVDVAA